MNQNEIQIKKISINVHLENSVNDQPSTTMSCKEARKANRKKIPVKIETLSLTGPFIS